MNTLAYGLLSLIAMNPCTGYDLTQRIQLLFWNAKHSQIYPLLARMEEKGWVSHEVVAQTDKPDKKIYSLTETGREALRSWIREPTDPPVNRDKFTLKIFSIGLTDPAAMKRLLEERVAYLTAKLERLDKRTEEIMERMGITGDLMVPLEWSSPYYGVALLIDKAKTASCADLDWCRRILDTMQLP